MTIQGGVANATAARPRYEIWPLAIVVLAGGAATLAIAQLGLKDLIAVLGLAAIGISLFVVRQRPRLLLIYLVFGLQFLLHKSIGPIVKDVSGGAPSIYVTSLDLILVLLYGFWMFQGTLISDVRQRLAQPVFIVPMIGLLLTIPSLVNAADLFLSISELTRMTWMLLLFVYIALRVRSRQDVSLTIATLFVVAVVQFIVVVLQWKTGTSLGLSFLGEESDLNVRTLDGDIDIPRPTGTVVHADFLAALVAPIALFAFSLAVRHAIQPRMRALFLGVFVVAATPLLLSQTRAAIVGFGVAGAFLAGWYLWSGHLRWRSVAYAFGGAAVPALLLWGRIQEAIINNFGTDHFRLELESRFELNRLAMDMFGDSPLIGVGLNNFERVQDRYDTFGLIFANNPVHNLYLLVLSETGLVGLIGLGATALILFGLAARLMVSRDPLFAAVAAAVAATYVFFTVEEVMTFSLRHDMPLALLWLLSGLLVACWQMHRETARGGEPNA